VLRLLRASARPKSFFCHFLKGGEGMIAGGEGAKQESDG